MRKTGLFLIAVLAAAALACNAPASSTTTPDPSPGLPVSPTEATGELPAAPTPTSGGTSDLVAVQQTVAQAWASPQDTAAMQSVMADPFQVLGPDAPAGEYAPAEAIAFLQQNGYFTSAAGGGVSSDTDIPALIGYDPSVAVPDMDAWLFMGQSDNGNNVILGFDQTADGRAVWRALLFVPPGYVQGAIFQDINTFTEAFINAVQNGNREFLKQFIPQGGVLVRSAQTGDFLIDPADRVMDFVFLTGEYAPSGGGGGGGGGNPTAVSNYDDVVALMGNPYEDFPDAQQFVIIRRPGAPEIIAVIVPVDAMYPYAWTDIVMP